jgi:hypothetical protein
MLGYYNGRKDEVLLEVQSRLDRGELPDEELRQFIASIDPNSPDASHRLDWLDHRKLLDNIDERSALLKKVNPNSPKGRRSFDHLSGRYKIQSLRLHQPVTSESIEEVLKKLNPNAAYARRFIEKIRENNHIVLLGVPDELIQKINVSIKNGNETYDIIRGLLTEEQWRKLASKMTASNERGLYVLWSITEESSLSDDEKIEIVADVLGKSTQIRDGQGRDTYGEFFGFLRDNGMLTPEIQMLIRDRLGLHYDPELGELSDFVPEVVAR